MVSTSSTAEDTGTSLTTQTKAHDRKRKHGNAAVSSVSKRPKVDNEPLPTGLKENDTVSEKPVTLIPDINRTGAKCVIGDTADPKLPGSGYHVTGVLRTKPGRGDPTRSMCCSDKIMRWNFLGCQGALLNHYIPSPVYFSTITIGGKRFDMEAVRRALITRLTGCKAVDEFVVNEPIIRHAELAICVDVFDNGKKMSHTGNNNQSFNTN